MGKKLIAWLVALGMCFSLTSCADLLGGLGIGGESLLTSSESASENSEEKAPNNSSEDNNENNDDEENEGEKQSVTVTFKQAGKADIVKTVEKFTALTDIPTPVEKKGYTIVWDKTDFRNITEDIVVTAIETIKVYTITFEANVGTTTQTTMTITYGDAYQLPQATSEDGAFKGWSYNGASVEMEGVWEMDIESNAIVLVAEWDSEWTGSY